VRALVRDMKDPRRKAGNDRMVSLTDQAAHIIERQPRTDARIFPWQSVSVGDAFSRGCKMAGIKDLRLHDLRHECTSWLFELGHDIPRVSQVTGHQSWSSLQVYAHLEGLETGDKYAGWRWTPTPRVSRLEVVG